LKYSLTSANDAAERDPVSWVLYASKNGSNWETIDTRQNQKFIGRYSTMEYPIISNQTYSHFKLVITEIQNGSMFQLTEWQLFEKENTATPQIQASKYQVSASERGIYIQSAPDESVQYAVYHITGYCIEKGNLLSGESVHTACIPGLNLVSLTSSTDRYLVKILI